MTRKCWFVMQKPESETVLVLDLDDTLYSEEDYVISGIKHSALIIKNLFGLELQQELLSLYQSDRSSDFLDYAIGKAKLPGNTKESLLWLYRLHSPDIQLATSVKSWLQQSLKKFYAVAILTDGRAVTQRLKIEALGLGNLPAYISEEWGAAGKPDPRRFVAIQQRWPDKQYLYIGDNPAKDFIAPNRLGWITVGLKSNGRNVHQQRVEPGGQHLPTGWVEHLTEVSELF